VSHIILSFVNFTVNKPAMSKIYYYAFFWWTHACLEGIHELLIQMLQIGAHKIQKCCSCCRPGFTRPAQSSSMRLTHCAQKGVSTQSMKLHGASRQSCWHRWMASNPTGSYKGFRGEGGCDHDWELGNI